MGTMTSTRFKYIRFGAIYGIMLLALLAPVYMYFSHDVDDLKEMYPHAQISKEDISFAVKKGKPKSWVTLSQISRYGKWAIILSEDWGFYQHEGIDVNQIKVALNEMMEAQRFRGASTITQQMVKNVYLSEDRTLWRKLHEIILAQKVERVLTKKRILEIYLNVIEFGPGIYGIKAAASHYFKKHPSELNPKESAFLAMMLPSPKRYYVSFKNRKLTRFAEERIEAILVKMRMGKVLSLDEYQTWKFTKMSWEK